MRVFYVGDEEAEAAGGKSIFLAGPTPDIMSGGKSWRELAIKILGEYGFTGVVFVPERRPGFFTRKRLPEDVFTGFYNEQVEWEEAHLKRATVIAFWIPRDLKRLPGFTTNIEWGRWESSGKIVFGAPHLAEKMRYVRYYAKRLGIPTAFTLHGTLSLAMKLVEDKRDKQDHRQGGAGKQDHRQGGAGKRDEQDHRHGGASKQDQQDHRHGGASKQDQQAR